MSTEARQRARDLRTKRLLMEEHFRQDEVLMVMGFKQNLELKRAGFKAREELSTSKAMTRYESPLIPTSPPRYDFCSGKFSVLPSGGVIVAQEIKTLDNFMLELNEFEKVSQADDDERDVQRRNPTLQRFMHDLDNMHEQQEAEEVDEFGRSDQVITEQVEGKAPSQEDQDLAFKNVQHIQDNDEDDEKDSVLSKENEEVEDARLRSEEARMKRPLLEDQFQDELMQKMEFETQVKLKRAEPTATWDSSTSKVKIGQESPSIPTLSLIHI